jgi:hypothetical protein
MKTEDILVACIEMIWCCECPFWWDQGVVGPVILESGEIVLACDSCGAMWRTLEDATITRESDGDDNREIGGRDPAARPATVRWAERADLAGTPWADLEWKNL